VAALFYALAPESTRLVRDHINNVFSAASNMSQAKQEIPPHLSREYIGDYLEYSIDAAQVFPTFALPAVGALFALHSGLSALGAVLLLGLGIPCLVFIGLRVLLAEPIAYVGKKYFRKRYTFLPATGMLLNVLAAVVVTVFL
jgi:hypothetical protein